MRSESPLSVRKPLFSSLTTAMADTDMPDASPSTSATSSTRLLSIPKRRVPDFPNPPTTTHQVKIPLRTTSISSPIPYHGPGGYSNPHQTQQQRRAFSVSGINRVAPANNPNRRSRFVEEDDGSSIQSSGANFNNNNNNNQTNGSQNGGSTSSRWSGHGGDGGGWTYSTSPPPMPTMNSPMVDMRDAVSPENPPIGFDRAAWKEYIGAIEKRREEQVELMRKQLRTQEKVRAAKESPPITGPRVTELPDTSYRIISPPPSATPIPRSNTLPTKLSGPPPAIRKRTSSLRHRFGSILSNLSPTDDTPPTVPRKPEPTESLSHSLHRRASIAFSLFSLTSTTAADKDIDKPTELPRKLTKSKPRPRAHTHSTSLSAISPTPTTFDLLSPTEQARITEGRRNSTPAMGMGNFSMVESNGNSMQEVNGSKRALETLDEGMEKTEFNSDGVGWGKRRKVREGWRRVGRRISGVLRIKDI